MHQNRSMLSVRGGTGAITGPARLIKDYALRRRIPGGSGLPACRLVGEAGWKPATTRTDCPGAEASLISIRGNESLRVLCLRPVRVSLSLVHPRPVDRRDRRR